MFFSLIQTLVCVLLVNGSLYALHLSGSSTNGQNGAPTMGLTSPNGHSSGHSSSGQMKSSSSSSSSSSNPHQSSSSRLNEELADLAQLERERLMVLGLAKQTAEESGYHGRPVITGRIKMHPAAEIDPDYSAWLNQQAHNVIYGSVVKQPPALMNDDAEQDYDTGGGGNYAAPRRPSKYEYGRVVQPADREFESPHNLDLDDFMELESVADEEEMFPDLDGYAYIEDLMAEENKERVQHQQTHHQNVPQFPGFRQQPHHSNPFAHSYQTQEHLEAIPQTLQELFEKEQQHSSHQQQSQQQQQQQLQQQLQQQQQQLQQQQQHQFNPKYRNNIRLQQKWQRKRAQLQQQQMQLPRNIFGQKNKQQHYFKTQSTNKLSLANSEATATSKVNNNNKHENEQQQQKVSNDNQVDADKNNNANKTEKPSTVSAIGEQQLLDQILFPNHKRSGGGFSGFSSSLASQLMLRTARGQRQYDVPQIECPTAMDGMERFACPTPDVQGRYRCIDDHVLCDGFIDCPEGEDEDRRSCMFYKTTKAHLDVLADALLRWARGR